MIDKIILISITFQIFNQLLTINAQQATPNLNCNVYEFQCENGNCIDRVDLCNGQIDCSDGSDETITTCISIHCPKYSFRCAYGACISDEGECNNRTDCVDGSDELTLKCPGVLEKLSGRGSCPEDNYECQSGQCIADDMVCDGKSDCKDGTDETVHRCAYYPCPSFSFRCGYGACIDQYSKCDGFKDCADGSDELKSLCGHDTIINKTRPDDFNFQDSSIVEGSCHIAKIPHSGIAYLDSFVKTEVKVGDYVNPYDTIVYECPKTHFFVGDKKNFCAQGSWSHPTVGDCKKYCSHLKLNGLSVDPYCEYKGTKVECDRAIRPGTIITFQCKFGYKRPDSAGSQILYCQEDGEYDKQIPKCEQICGVEAAEATPNVIGGEYTNNTKVPWHVGVYSDLIVRGKWNQICGGTIINPKVVISAAHCFYDESQGRFINESHYAIAAGKYYRDYYANEQLVTQTFNVSKFHYRPTYRGYSQRYADDIMMIILDNYLVFNNYIKPICIDYSAWKEIEKGLLGRVAGWGLTQADGISSERLKVIQLPTLNTYECIRLLSETFQPFVTNDKFCAGEANGASVCQGDSGGGLVFPKTNSDGEKVYYLKGIVSLGDNRLGYCDNYEYSLFTNILFFDWFIKANSVPFEYG